MKRSTGVVVIVAAALIGCSGGTYVATSMPDRHQEPVVSSSTPTPGAGSTTEADAADPGGSDSRRSPGNPALESGSDSAQPRLFYLADGRIHDGDREVEVELSRSWPVSSLQRLGDGWLITQLRDGGKPRDHVGTVVYPDGRSWDLGRIGGGWDITVQAAVLFSPDIGSWSRADPKTRTISKLDLDHDSGDRLPVTEDGDPESWIQWTKSGVLTGWDASDGTHLVHTGTDQAQSTTGRGSQLEVGGPGVQHPNTSPDGEFVVGDTISDSDRDGGEDGGSCLTGGPLAADGWWHNCDVRRLSTVSPYSPNGRRLLGVDAHSDDRHPDEFDILDARTGAPYYMIDAPERTYDAAWADDENLTVLARPNGHNRKRTLIYQVDLGGNAEQVESVKGKVTLGTP